MNRLQPDHLTPFGVWLWRRWPWFEREKVAKKGEAFHGFKSPRGKMYAGVLTDYYHGLWPLMGLLYWRRSVWILGVKVLWWRRYTHNCNNLPGAVWSWIEVTNAKAGRGS